MSLCVSLCPPLGSCQPFSTDACLCLSVFPRVPSPASVLQPAYISVQSHFQSSPRSLCRDTPCGCSAWLSRMLLANPYSPWPSPSRSFNTHFFLNVLGLLFAVSEAKEDPAFPSSVTVVLQAYDSCISGSQAPASIPALLSNQPRPTPSFLCGPRPPLLGVVGGVTSPESEPMAQQQSQSS